uniref:Protein SCO1 homolog n=1 Tax=Hirondellea gigas TaxID=1518452 RepID=A0A2P2I3M2_9CRUS
MHLIFNKLYSFSQHISNPARTVLKSRQCNVLVPLQHYCSKPSSSSSSSGTSNAGADGEKKPPTLQDLKKKSFKWNMPITWRSLLITAAFGAVALAVMFNVKKKKEILREKENQRALGKAKIGGKFDLIDQNGNALHSDTLLGQWLIVYFGFTHCPDICPDELEKLAQVVDLIDGDKSLENIQPVFITVDPLRDTVAAVKAYVAEFHPKFIGLTGSVERIAEACKAYRVYFSAGPKDEDNDYIVDHTIIMYLVNPEGNFVDYYGQTKTAKEITNSIMISMAKYNLAK